MWFFGDPWLYLLLVPGLLFYLIFMYWPMYGLIIAFQDFNIFRGISGSPFVGFENFSQLFNSKDFFTIFTNTLSLNFYDILFGFPVPIILAIMLNELKSKYFVSSIKSMLYLPYFFSWVVVGGVLINILSPKYGFINGTLSALGMETIFFMGEKNWWVIVYVVSSIWKVAGWGTIIYIAALTGIDKQLYDAAKIDGANRWKQIIHVTFPGIKSTIAVLLILRVGRILTIGFEQPFMLSNALVIERADVLSTYIYRAGILQSQYSLTTAMGLFQSLIGLMMIVVADRIIKSIGEAGVF